MPSNAPRHPIPRWLAIVACCVLAGCGSAPQKPAEPAEQIVFPKPPDAPRFVYEQTIFGTNAVKAVSDEDRMRVLLTGSMRREGIAFSKPFDVAVREGRLHVTDTVERAVLVLDFPGGREFTIGDRGDDGDLAKPIGVAVDEAGRIYVSDISLKGVNIYDREGQYLGRIDVSEWALRPSGIDVSPAGDRLFLVDTGGIETDRHQVLVIDVPGRQLLATLGRRGTEDGELNLPRDVHLGRDGLLYVTDGGNFRVQAFTQQGEFVRKWGQPGRRLGQFSRPKGIAVDPDGNIYVVDAAFGNFQIFDPDGNLLMFVGDRSTTLEPAKFMLPSGIDVDEDGRVYMVDQFFRKIDVFRPADLGETAGWFGKRASKP